MDYCLDKCEDDFPLSFNGGSLAAGDHMVQKPPFWRAKSALGRLKQSNLISIFFVLYVKVRNLLSSMAVFVPRDLQLQRANLVSIRFKVSTTDTRWTTDDRSTSLMQLTSVRKQID